MKGWTRHEGMAAGLPQENIDTDQLIPARFMSAPRSEGYGKFLLHDLRFDADGTPRDFPLGPGTSVVVTRRNFGSGSSREAAVYALVDFGIRVVVAPSFGDIFASNAVNNGLLPARVTPEMAEQLLGQLAAGPVRVVADLETGHIRIGDESVPFDLVSSWRDKLINGWDDIDLTLRHRAEIATFAERYRRASPWTWPRGTG